jgi:hypothetical protein
MAVAAPSASASGIAAVRSILAPKSVGLSLLTMMRMMTSTLNPTKIQCGLGSMMLIPNSFA